MNRRIQARAIQANEDATSVQPSDVAVELGQLLRDNISQFVRANRGRCRGGGRTVRRP